MSRYLTPTKTMNGKEQEEQEHASPASLSFILNRTKIQLDESRSDMKNIFKRMIDDGYGSYAQKLVMQPTALGSAWEALELATKEKGNGQSSKGLPVINISDSEAESSER